MTAPTCTEVGYTTYTCTCGDSYVSNVDALGHDCSNWLNDEDDHWKTCNRCDSKLHTATHINDDGDNLCDVCGYQVAIFTKTATIAVIGASAGVGLTGLLWIALRKKRVK